MNHDTISLLVKDDQAAPASITYLSFSGHVVGRFQTIKLILTTMKWTGFLGLNCRAEWNDEDSHRRR